MSSVLTHLPPASPLTLVDALKIVAQNPQSPETDTFTAALACSFTPLHLQTFLNAELRLRLRTRRVTITTGLFDNLSGTLASLHDQSVDVVVVVIEWFDLDARLGLRRLGGWSPHDLPDIVERAQSSVARLGRLIEGLARPPAIVLSLPTLPLPPLFSTAGWQASSYELELRQCLWSFAATVARNPKVRVVSDAVLGLASPLSERLNIQSTWTSGFPYRTTHAARLAQLLARAAHGAPPKKGLITDLDDTLWSGIVGDDGVEKISWDLDHHSQAHGVYQQFLSALSDAGVLIGVASKNDPDIVSEAFARDDLLLRKDQIFPQAVSWGSKARAVSEVLKAWNVSADSVVLVDDNPSELEEVKTTHPEIECLRFSRDPDAVYQLITYLRDLFGKSIISEEDRLRLASLRSGAPALAHSDDAAGYSESLLEEAQSEVTLDFTKDPADARALELINKTNQFNLNGRRIPARLWAEFLEDRRTFVVTATYRDRFGPLGKIAVIAGRVSGSDLQVNTWVMSCRAFARRIEHQCLMTLFEQFDTRTAAFDYEPTPRNGPLARFLSEIAGSSPRPGLAVPADSFRAACPRLFHRVIVKSGARHE